MPRLFVISRDGTRKALEAEAGISLMENLRNSGTEEILALCGGCCSCATCHVYVSGACLAALPPMKADESDLLSGLDTRREGSRLSCQIRVDDTLEGLELTIAPQE